MARVVRVAKLVCLSYLYEDKGKPNKKIYSISKEFCLNWYGFRNTVIYHKQVHSFFFVNNSFHASGNVGTCYTTFKFALIVVSQPLYKLHNWFLLTRALLKKRQIHVDLINAFFT